MTFPALTAFSLWGITFHRGNFKLLYLTGQTTTKKKGNKKRSKENERYIKLPLSVEQRE
jgi:hypothetical protein